MSARLPRDPPALRPPRARRRGAGRRRDRRPAPAPGEPLLHDQEGPDGERAAGGRGRRPRAGRAGPRSGGRSRPRGCAWPGPPSSRTTPNDVNVNRNVISAAEAIAGRSAGSVTARAARHGDAPSTRAASSVAGSRSSHSPPTVRTTTAWLKNAWARRIAHTVPSQVEAERRRSGRAARGTRRPPPPSAARTAPSRAPARRAARGTRSGPARGRRAGRRTSVSAVDAAACQSVNHATRAQRGVAQHVADAVQVPAVVAPQALADDVGDRPREERRRGTPPAAASSPTSRRRVARSRSPDHEVGPLVDPVRAVRVDLVGGQLERRRPATTACCANTSGQGGVPTHREHEHRQRHVGLEGLRQQEVDELPGLRPRARCPAGSRRPRPGGSSPR